MATLTTSSPISYLQPVRGLGEECASSPVISGEPASTAMVDWDNKGRVTRTRFSDGQICQFRYDEDGQLYGFIYGKLAWSSTDGGVWVAQDSANIYTVNGRITVNVDGTISIERQNFTRLLKLNGLIVDVFKDGNSLELQRPAEEQTATDLLADVRRKTGVLTSQSFVPTAVQQTQQTQLTQQTRAARSGDSLSSLSLSPSGSQVMIEPSLAVTGSAHGPGLLSGNSIQPEYLSGNLRSGHSDRARMAGREALRQSGAYSKPQEISGGESSGRRPLAVGKRINNLRVADDASNITVEPVVHQNSYVALKQKFEEVRLRALESLRGTDSDVLLPCLDALADMYWKSRRINEAREIHERALKIRCKNLGALHSDTSINLHGLAVIYHEWGRYTEAEDQYAQAIRVSGKGLQKARFMRESNLISDADIAEQIGRLLKSILSLARLYRQQERRNLCSELLLTATNVRNSVDETYHLHFEQTLADLTLLTAPDHEDSHKPPAAYASPAKIGRV